MQLFGAVLLLIALAFSAICEDVLYKGYKLYDVQATARDQIELLQSVSHDLELDFWSPPAVGRKSSVFVSPRKDELFRTFLSEHNVTHRLSSEGVQRLIDHERDFNEIRNRKRRNVSQNDTIPIVSTNGTSFEYFWSLNEIYQYLDMLARKYPNLVKLFGYGKTYENRSIKVITISTAGKVNGSRPIVLVDGGIHAREWASHMSVVYLIYQLVERSTENMVLLNNTDWVIMPVVNPDGYEYTQKDRLWRKNRSPINGTSCFGTDLNRNFPIGWTSFGSKCSVGYAGPAPASELETRALMKLMRNYSNATKVYLTVHSCGDFILYPFGYKNEEAPNKMQLQALGEEAAAAVRAINGPKYSVGSSAALLYPANGSDDYIYENLNVEYSYTLELSCGNSNNTSIFIISIFVLTAAHCITESPENARFAIWAGSHDITVAEANRQNINVEETIVHPEYLGGVNPSDVGLMRLQSYLNFNAFVQAATLQPGGSHAQPGPATLAGWGSTSTTTVPSMPAILQKVVKPIIDYDTCTEANGGPGNSPLGPTNVCTGPLTGGVSACSGDSGGPLFVIANGVQTQVGIVSWGWMPCGSVGRPSVYVGISHYRDWIDTNSA